MSNLPIAAVLPNLALDVFLVALFALMARLAWSVQSKRAIRYFVGGALLSGGDMLLEIGQGAASALQRTGLARAVAGASLLLAALVAVVFILGLVALWGDWPRPPGRRRSALGW